MKRHHFLLLLAFFLTITGCHTLKKDMMREMKQAKIPDRQVDATDVQVPSGYKVEVVAKDFTYPTAATFDDQGNLYVIEAGFSYGGDWETPKLIRVSGDGTKTTIATGGKNGPWTGVTYYKDYFYIAEGGRGEGGKILKVSPDGKITTLVENIPSMGDHFTESPVIGPDGYLYFTVGTATNSGVVGLDNFKMWLPSHKDFHDVPCGDITLTGENFTTPNPLKDNQEKAVTGAFVPFGTFTTKGQIIKGTVPCSGSVERVNLNGGKPELVAWGFRNPYSLAFQDRQLYVTENGFDIRGSRPIRTNGDHLWKVQQGMWYGWPDFEGGKPVQSEVLNKGEKPAKPLLASYPDNPPQPVAVFGVHSSADGIAFSKNNSFGQEGKAFVAEFGDMTPMTGATTSPVGFKVVTVDVNSGHIEDFMTNKKKNAPASMMKGKGIERPLGVTFSPDGKSLYVVDFGILQINGMPVPKHNSGVLWKVTKL